MPAIIALLATKPARFKRSVTLSDERITDLERSHAELRADVPLAGREIRKLSFGETDSLCSSCFAAC